MISIMKMPKAYSYIRWSTAMQADGDSDRRQLEMAEKFVAKHGLELVPENVMRDEGKSAFTGKNVSEGALGLFLQAIANGKIESGSFLLVEALDRLSRQEPAHALQMFLSIINGGVVVVTLSDGIEYRTGEMDMMKLFGSIIKMSVAHEESAKKRFRSKENWENKRKNAIATGIKMTGNCPGWLALSQDKKTFIVNEERASVVRRIFQMSQDGMGTYTIAKTLNREQVPTFRGKSHWQVAAVRMGVLRNKAVIGEFQPQRRGDDGKEKIPDGELIKGYFPAIISEANFYSNQAAIARRTTAGVGRKGKTFANLFTGIAFCSECGGKMYVNQHNRYRSSKIIYCSQADNGTCNTKSWQYDRFEQSFLSFVREIDLVAIIEGGTGSRTAEITSELEELEGEKQDLESKVNRLLLLFEEDAISIETIKVKVKPHQTRLEEIADRTGRLSKERLDLRENQRASKEPKIFSFPGHVSDEELYSLRAKAAEHIRSVVESIHMFRGRTMAKSDEALGKLLSGWPLSSDPKYLVRFKGGGSRMIWPQRSNPGKVWQVKDMAYEALMDSEYAKWIVCKSDTDMLSM